MKRLLLLASIFTLLYNSIYSQSVNVTIDQNSSTVCAGTKVRFTATVSNAGGPFAYQWIKNLSVVSDRNTPTTKDTSQYIDEGLNDGDEIYCYVTNNGAPINSNIVKLTVNPKPSITNYLAASICSGSAPNIALTASANSNFSWTIGRIANGVTGAAAGTGVTINQTLTNPTHLYPGSVEYVVTPTSMPQGCAGTPSTFEVTVHPRPVLQNNAVASVCSGNSLNISLTASTTSSFSWTIESLAGGITGASAGTGGSIIQALVNPSKVSAGSVQYAIIPTSSFGCAGSATSILVTVFPKLVFGNDTMLFVACGNDLIDLNNTYNSAGYTLTWNAANPAATDTGDYKVIATNGNGCSDTVNVFVRQDIAVWTGAASTDWHTAANWNTGRVPGKLTNVIVHAGSQNDCIIHAEDGVAASVQVLQGGSLKLTNGHNVNVTGKCNVLPVTGNPWDGRYEVTGSMVDLANPNLTGLFPMQYNLITTTPTQVVGFDPVYWMDHFIPILSSGSVSGYGAFCPVFTFDPFTNKIMGVTNSYGQPSGNTRSAELDPSGENMYDPVTKTIKVKFFMKQPSVIATPPNIRTTFDWTMTYLHPR